MTTTYTVPDNPGDVEQPERKSLPGPVSATGPERCAHRPSTIAATQPAAAPPRTCAVAQGVSQISHPTGRV